MVKLEAGSTPSKSFRINGLDYPSGVYEAIYSQLEVDSTGAIIEDTLQIGLRNINTNAIITSPSPINQWVNTSDVPYTTLAGLLVDITNLCFSTGGGNGVGVPTQDHIFENAAARDAFFTDNLNELITGTPIFVGGVDLGGGATGTQLQEWGGVDNPDTYDNTDWVSGGIMSPTAAQIKSLYESNADTNAFTDTSSALLGTLDGVTNGNIPLKDASGYIDSALTETTDSIVSTKSIITPDSSVALGNLQMSNGGFSLRVQELASSRIFYPISTELLSEGTNRPYQWDLGVEATTPAAADISETFSGNTIQFRIINANSGIATQYKFNSTTNTNDVNFQIRVGGYNAPVPVFDWGRATGGNLIDFVTGENTLTLPLPQFFEAGIELFVTVSSPNNISLRGQTLPIPLSAGGTQNETVPYIETVGRLATRREMAYLEDVTSGLRPSTQGEITSFRLDGTGTTVAANSVLSGNQTFSFSLNNPSLFTGTLTLTQDRVEIQTGILPTATSITTTVNTKTFGSAPDVLTFELTGVNTNGDTQAIRYVVSSSGSAELVYSGLSSTNNPATVVLEDLSSQIVGTGTLTIDTEATTDGDFFIILVPTDHDVVTITDTVLNQEVYPSLTVFTRVENVRVIDSTNYISYVIGPLHEDATGEEYILMLR